MYNSFFYSYSSGSMRSLAYLLLIVDLILKGITLYKSARRGQTVWFVALLLINSVGILPLVYLVINKDIFVQTKSNLSTGKTVKKNKRK